MQQKDMILVSVDDHIVEPPGLFDRHIPAQWKGREPQLVTHADAGTQGWEWAGGASTRTFINAVVTLPKEEWGLDPSSLAELRPGRDALAQTL